MCVFVCVSQSDEGVEPNFAVCTLQESLRNPSVGIIRRTLLDPVMKTVCNT